MERLLAAARAVLVKTREIWGDHPPAELQELSDAADAAGGDPKPAEPTPA